MSQAATHPLEPKQPRPHTHTTHTHTTATNMLPLERKTTTLQLEPEQPGNHSSEDSPATIQEQPHRDMSKECTATTNLPALSIAHHIGLRWALTAVGQ